MKRLTYFFVNFWIFILFFSTIAHKVTLAEDPFLQKSIAQIEQRYGVVIHSRFKNSFYPESWQNKPIYGKGLQATEENVIRLLPVIENFLKSYPKSIINQNLKNIYIVKDLEFYGKSFGGTWHGDSIYINCNSKVQGYTKLYWKGVLHHEFSSLLMTNHEFFPKKQWLSLLPNGFHYLGSSRAALGKRNVSQANESLYRQGFLSKYAMSSLENDFNVFVEWGTTRQKELAKALKNPIIEKKFQLVKEFYWQISPSIHIFEERAE